MGVAGTPEIHPQLIIIICIYNYITRIIYEYVFITYN